MRALKKFAIRVTQLNTHGGSLFLLLTLALATAAIVYTHARAAVTLVYFNATGISSGVFLEWETASELDNNGFFVNRSTSQSGGFTRVSSFIPTSGDPLLGGDYQYTDTDLTLGTTYWYKLESIDIQSNSEMYNPPVPAVAGTSNTPTPTRTATHTGSTSQTSTTTPTATARTRTPTATSTVRASSRTPTATQYTSNASSQPASSNQQPAQQPPPPPPGSQDQPTNDVLAESQTTPFTGTATLIPLPEITMEFPSLSVSNPAIPTPPSMPPVSISSVLKWLTPTRVLIVILIVFVWIFLGGWFYSTIRRVE